MMQQYRRGIVASGHSRPAPQLTEMDVFPVILTTLKPETALRFDLYRRQQIGERISYVLYRHRERVFTTEVRQTLLSYGVDTLYVNRRDRDLYEEQSEPIDSDEARVRLEAMLVERAQGLYRDFAEAAKGVLGGLVTYSALDEVHSSCEQLVDFATRSPEAYGYLLSIKQDNYQLYLHSVNVAILSVGLARRIGIGNHEMLRYIGIGALLHDVGMSRMPREILEKDGPLTRSERSQVQQHPYYGMEMLHQMQGVHWIVRKIIREHHEKFDGSGYPHGMDARHTHLSSRIVTQTEIYDTLTNPRSYGEVMSPREALELMIYEMRGELDYQVLVELIKFIGSLRVPTEQASSMVIRGAGRRSSTYLVHK